MVGWSRAIRVLLPLAALAIEGWPALVGAVFVQEGGLWLCGRIADPCRREQARMLYVGAYALRMLLALPSHYYERLRDGSGALFLDDYTNDLIGEWLVRIARGDGIAIFPGHQHLLASAYSYLLMGIYAALGYAPLVPKLLNIGFAALSVVLVFEIASQMFRTSVGLLAAIGAAILPTMIIWSIATLKESLVLVLALFGLWTVQLALVARRDDPRIANALVALLAAVLLLLDLRSSSALILLVLLAVALAARSRYRPRPWQVALASVAVVIVLGSGLLYARSRTSNRSVAGIVEDIVLQVRHRRAQEAASAGSQLRPEQDVLSATGTELPLSEAASDAAPFTFVGDVLEPLGYALFAPTPWQAHSLPELAASAEMPVWYALLATSLVAWRASPRQKLFTALLASYAVANWLVLAAAEGNVGNLLRHRLLLDPALLILGGAGLAWLWERSGRPFGERVPRRRFVAAADST
jgi:4-amino-4-deoxy-L-arabinose transferase-like glycosyltransferase